MFDTFVSGLINILKFLNSWWQRIWLMLVERKKFETINKKAEKSIAAYYNEDKNYNI